MFIEVIEQVGNMRLIRMADTHFDMEDLKGDMFNSAACPEIDSETLAEEERLFERRVNEDGVWGYEVQRWNGDVDGGWEHVDSIWGFVGDAFNGSGHDTDLLAQLTNKAEV